MSRTRRIVVLVSSLIAAVALGIGDVSSYLPELTAFVLIPVVACTYYLGFRHGALIAVVAAVSELMTHVVVEAGPHTEVIANTLTHTGIYIFTAALLSRLVIQLRITTALEKQRSEELDIAKRVHKSFFSTLPQKYDDLSIGRRVAFARELGGDYYYAHILGDRLFFCIADISGKGTAAALFTAQLNQSVIESLESSQDLTVLVESVNAHMLSTLPEDMFVTIFCAFIDDGGLEYVNAGHPPPLLYAATDGSVKELESHDVLPIGINPNLRIESSKVPFVTGDIFFAGTDGVTDSLAFRGQPYEKLEAMLTEHAADGAQGVADAIFEEAVPAGTDFPFDDVIVLCVKRNRAR